MPELPLQSAEVFRFTARDKKIHGPGQSKEKERERTGKKNKESITQLLTDFIQERFILN